MATFIPQVQGHLATVEAFQPDFGFIQGWLETKQGKYNEGLAQINSAYSLLKDLPLTLDENISKRDQFFATADSQIKRMASMDLSLDQNVMAAKNIFNPLATDEGLLEDFGITTQAYAVMNTANRFRNSGDEETRKRYNPLSVNYASLKLEEYKLSNPDRRKEIAGQGIKYVDNVDVMARATKIADALKLDITAPVGTTKDGAYDITARNGDLILGTLNSAIKMQLSSDPLVAEYFNQQGYVAVQSELQARAKEIGYDAAQAEIVQKYVDNPALMAASEAELQKNKEALQNLQNEREEAEQQINSEGVVPGSDEHKRYLAILDGIKGLEGTNAVLETINGNVVQGSYDRKLENAYYNAGLMSMDMQLSNAAQILSMRNAEIKHTPNVYFKLRREHQYRMAELDHQHELSKRLHDYKNPQGAAGPFQFGGGGARPSTDKMSLLEVQTDKDGRVLNSRASQEQSLAQLSQEGESKQGAFIAALIDVDPAIAKKLQAQGISRGSWGQASSEQKVELYKKAMSVYAEVAESAPTKGYNLTEAALALTAADAHTIIYNQQAEQFDKDITNLIQNAMRSTDIDSPMEREFASLLIDENGKPRTKEQFLEVVRNTKYFKDNSEPGFGDYLYSLIPGTDAFSTAWKFGGLSNPVGQMMGARVSQQQDLMDDAETWWRSVQAGLSRAYETLDRDDVRIPFHAGASMSATAGAGGVNIPSITATYTSGKNVNPQALAFTEIYQAAMNAPYRGSVYNGELPEGLVPTGKPSANAEQALEILTQALNTNIGKNNETSPRPSLRVLQYAGENKDQTAVEITFDAAWIGKNRVTDNANTSGRPIDKGVSNTVTIMVPSNQFYAPSLGNSAAATEWNRISSTGAMSLTVPGAIDADWNYADGILSFSGNRQVYNNGKYGVEKFSVNVGSPGEPASYSDYINLRNNVWNQVQQQVSQNLNARFQYNQANGVKDPQALTNGQ